MSVENSTEADSEGADFESLLFSQATEITWKFIPPVIIVLGTFGNVMTIVMMRRMSEGQSSHTMSLYFTALAVSDLTILYVGLLHKWLLNGFDINVLLFHDALCKLQFFLINTFGTISAWLLVSMTTQRVFSVAWPYWKNVSCPVNRFVLNLIIIIIVPIGVNSYRLYAYSVLTRPNSLEIICGVMVNKALVYFDWYVYPYIDLTIASLLPFGILMIGNSVLVWKVIQSVHVARVMTAGGCDQVNSRQKKASSLTLTLITVSLAFLLLTAPVCVCIALNPFIETTGSQASPKTKFAWVVCDLSWYINSAINFYLYCLSGTKFKNELRRLVCTQCHLDKIMISHVVTHSMPPG
ncbi:probable G-protein coupled receptor 139 [Pomacea canaliculata]|uniref:probable G-protein coupled receptor 139 n=1 Tax=Pomacea canaliculata TaxID=400727 RepID=UPI000D72B002|nr:probable G-protein coupled receptor 139 [Pomacea canaliculata]